MIHRTIISLSSIAILISLSSITYAAETVQLNNGNSFSGNISDSDTMSVLNLKHPFAETPIKFKESSIKQINFENNNKLSEYSELIQLTNGDRFPCDITSITQEKISFSSSTLGDHTIKRSHVSKITFNTKVNKVLYNGPGDDLSAWVTTNERWDLTDGILSATGNSRASIQIPNLTRNYILKFSTKRDRIASKFRFCFSASNNIADKQSDHYYIDFNSLGISLQRSRKGQYNSLVQILNNHDTFDAPLINVAIYVDRKRHKLALYLNNELIKVVTDTKHKTAPEGNFLVINNFANGNNLTQLSGISIHEWNGQITEESENSAEILKKHDLITDLNGSVITGNILSIAENNSSELTFKAPFTKSNSTIPKSSINVLEFKRSDNKEELQESNFSLSLVNGGKLHYINSQFFNSNLKLEHPILGLISIPKTTIKSLSAISQEAKDE